MIIKINEQILYMLTSSEIRDVCDKCACSCKHSDGRMSRNKSVVGRMSPCATGNLKDFESYYGGIKKFCLDYRNELRGNDVTDLMAGVGLSSSLFMQYLEPSRILMNDLSYYAYCVLKKNWGDVSEIAEITCDDAYAISHFHTDLLFADFNRFTALHIQNNPEARLLLDRIFADVRKYIIFTDSAKHGLERYGGRNYKVYEKLFGVTVETVDDYVTGFRMYSQRIFTNWFLIKAYVGESAIALVWSREEEELKIIRNTSPVHIEEHGIFPSLFEL